MAIARSYSRFAKPAPVRPMTPHVFAVGQLVRVLPSAFDRKPKEIEKSLYGSTFEVTRLLPAEASFLQYRIKSTTTGQERVASESELSADAPGA